MYIILQLQVALIIKTKVHTVKGTNIYTLLQFPYEKPSGQISISFILLPGHKSILIFSNIHCDSSSTDKNL